MNQMKKYCVILCCLSAIIVGFYSCNDDNGTGGGTPFIPGQSIVCKHFDPLEGGRATQMMLTADNLGNDPKMLEVYFDDRQAPVVGCNKGKALILVPRLPSTGEYIVRVKIGGQEASFNQKFSYTVRAVVTTVCGNPNSGDNNFRDGPFGLCVLRNPMYLACDITGNLFLSHQNQVGGGDANQNLIALINEQEEYVRKLIDCPNRPNAPSTDYTGKMIVVPADGGNWRDVYWEFDPEVGGAARERTIFHPTASEIANGDKVDWGTLDAFKHSFAICQIDQKVYYRGNRNGQIIRFHPRTREGEWATTLEKQIVADSEGELTEKNVSMYMLQNINGDSYLMFDPNPENAHMLYACICGGTGNNHIIAYLNVLTGETGIYAGGMGEDNMGWRDGPASSAKFYNPRQMVLDKDGNFLIADSKNHCIRKIDPRTGMVSTLVGIAGKAGYQDGNPDDALFNEPWGLCIKKEGEDETIYIADTRNHCVRKLIME